MHEVLDEPTAVENVAVFGEAIPVEVLLTRLEQRALEKPSMLGLRCETKRAEPAVPGYEGGHTLRGERIEVARLPTRGEEVHVGVGIDESRSDDSPGAIDRLACILGNLPHACDPALGEKDAAWARRRPAAIDEEAIAQKNSVAMRHETT